jgi:hypothetical protein
MAEGLATYGGSAADFRGSYGGRALSLKIAETS